MLVYRSESCQAHNDTYIPYITTLMTGAGDIIDSFDSGGETDRAIDWERTTTRHVWLIFSTKRSLHTESID